MILFLEIRRFTINGYYRSGVRMREEVGYAGKQYLMQFQGCTHERHLNWAPPKGSD